MKVLITLLATCLFSLSANALDATHGMVLFGKENVYAYHLPMFHKVHNKQMVLSFDLSPKNKDEIVNLQATTFLTFVPAPFDLEKFIAAPYNLTGDIYAGHFEQGGVLVMKAVVLINPKIEYLQDLVNPMGKQTQHYKVFGTKNDAYALYLINGGAAEDKIFKLTTTFIKEKSVDFQYLLQSHFLYNLELNGSFSMHSPDGKCPGRNCGIPGDIVATFTVDSLYFSDSVMGAMPEVKFCKTRLCHP